ASGVPQGASGGPPGERTEPACKVIPRRVPSGLAAPSLRARRAAPSVDDLEWNTGERSSGSNRPRAPSD
ncbi:hypothetical protein N8607_00770, partial [bacterium]|nr:hypothetical protein [bacterium]